MFPKNYLLENVIYVIKGGFMLLEKKKTRRNFGYYEFTDYYGDKCSLQKSSIVEPECIWLGIDNAIPKVLIQNEGWKECKLPEGAMTNTRMHLTQEQVKSLLPILQKFAETGNI